MSEVTFSVEEYDNVCAGLYIVQQSGLYNMIVDFGNAITATMCLLAVLDLKPLVTKLNSCDKQQYMKIFQFYIDNYNGKHKLWEGIADSTPRGVEYLKTVNRNIEVFNGDVEQETENIIQFETDNEFGWYRALTVYAEGKCLLKGYYMRDTIRLNACRGMHEVYELKAIGAQFI